MRHELKTDPAVFAAVLCGAKTHEIRFNDRNFQIADELLLKETTVAGEMIKRGYPLEYTGREITTTVTHVLEGYGLMPGWVILSIAAPEQKSPTAAQRWAKCVELSHNLCDRNGDFVVVQLPALGQHFGSTEEHFVAAIDAEIARECKPCLGTGMTTASCRIENPVDHKQFAIVVDRNFEGEGITLASWNGEQFQTTDGDCYDRDGDRLGPYVAEFLTDYQLQQRLVAPEQGDREEVFDLLRRIVGSDIGRTTQWRLSTGQGTQTIDGKAWLAAAAKVAGETSPEHAKPMGFHELMTALKQITAYKPKYQQEYAEQAVVLLERFATTKHATPFQYRVQPWLMECFGPVISADTQERNHRFLEEALELVQACGATRSEAHQLVDYVYGRPAGEPFQEVGGVMVTLAALCLAQKMDMHDAGEVELARVWTKIDKIRAKQATKPKDSALPEGPTAAVPSVAEE